MGAKALVTGCAGFIGSNLADRLLNDKFDVIGIDCFTDYYPERIKNDNISQSLKNPNFKLIKQNITDMDEYPDVDYVFHVAAQAGVRGSWGKSFDTYVKNNIEATQKLLEYYKNKKLIKFVYSSSSSVYGDSSLPMKETNMLKPVSPYGVTKLAAEHLCYLYWKNYNVPTISLRYFTVYGPRLRPDMAIYKFLKSINNNDEISVYGDGNQTRDFTHVTDVVEANRLASESAQVGQVYNIGGGNRITVKDLINIIEMNTGKTAKIKLIEKQKGDVEDTWADINKAKKELKWDPKIKITDGITSFTKWYDDKVLPYGK